MTTPFMTSGREYEPRYDSLMGVFCWRRLSDGATTLWDTGVEAELLANWCRTASPKQVDRLAARGEFKK